MKSRNTRRRKQQIRRFTHRRQWRQRGGRPFKNVQETVRMLGTKLEELTANYVAIQQFITEKQTPKPNSSEHSKPCQFWLDQATRMFTLARYEIELLRDKLDTKLAFYDGMNNTNGVNITNSESIIPDEFELLKTLSENIGLFCSTTKKGFETAFYNEFHKSKLNKWIIGLLLLVVNPSINRNFAIISASTIGDIDIVNMLLQDPRVDPSSVNNKAIRDASEKGHLDIVDRLLREPVERGVDPSAENNDAIRMAAIRGHLNIVDRLLHEPLDRGVDPSADGNYAIRMASLFGHLAVVDRLLRDPRVDPSARNNYAIREASAYGRLAVVERLLQEVDRGVDPSADDNFAIREASLNGHLAVVDRLLQEVDRGVDPSADYNYAIRWASANGHLAVVERLFKDPRVDPSARYNEAIQWASSNGHLAVVNLLKSHPRVAAALAAHPIPGI